MQRFYRCKENTTQYCIVTGVNSDSCAAGQGPCGRYGNGKPMPYGDDVCGDGSVDESTSDKWAAETALGENGHRIAQNQNFNISIENGPFLRFTPLEDFYDREAGESFQGAIGFIVYEGTPYSVPKYTYGASLDDMTVEWSESHPVEQAATGGCGNKTCTTARGRATLLRQRRLRHWLRLLRLDPQRFGVRCADMGHNLPLLRQRCRGAERG